MKESFFTESILYWLVRAVAGVSQRLPVCLSVACGARLGTAAYHLFWFRRALALGNLKAAFGDTYTQAEYEKILKGMFEHLGMTLMEVMRLPTMDRAYVDRWITQTPGTEEIFNAAFSKGRGVILLTAHFGNWEFGSIVSALYGHPMLVLVRQQGWPKLNRLLVAYRESKGSTVVTKGFPIRQLIEGLRRGQVVGMVADQDGGRNGVISPFLGRLASTASGAVALGIKTGAPILPTFVVRSHGAAHTLVMGEPLAIPETGELEERVAQGISMYLHALEGVIRRYPHQWLWLHRRWKSSPERHILLLSDGKAGHDAQARALSQRIETAWEKRLENDRRLTRSRKGLVHVKSVNIAYRHPVWRPILAIVAGVAPRRFPGGHFWLYRALSTESYRALEGSFADIGVSCGAATAPVNLLWAWSIRARAIHVTRSVFPSWRRFHLSVIPRHDLPRTFTQNSEGSDAKVRGRLVISGALSPVRAVSDTQINGWRSRLGLNGSKKIIGLLVGGPTPEIPFGEEEAQQLVRSLLRAAETANAELLVTSSRRTPVPAETRLKEMLSSHPRCRLLVLVNHQEMGGLSDSSEAIPCIFSLATYLVVSGDSISMISEALESGKPVVGFLPQADLLGKSKYRRFLRDLESQGKVVVAAPEKVGEAVLQLIGSRSTASPEHHPDSVVEYLEKWL